VLYINVAEKTANKPLEAKSTETNLEKYKYGCYLL